MKKILTLLILLPLGSYLLAQANFSTSLHATRAGKATYYNAENGGFENLTNVPIDSLGCAHCHGANDADGVAYGENYEPGCIDCHPSNSAFNPDSLDVMQCYSCHGRQKAVALMLKIPDVHRDAGMKCWDCHKADDIHGDGTEYTSLFEEGAIKTKCEDCHIDATSTPPLPDHSSYDPHSGKLDCTACHVQSVAACYNCHFESMTENHIKRQQGVISDFVMLVNRNGKVHTATFQSATFEGQTFNAFGPNASHTIGAGRKCEDCHNNANVQAYKNDGIIKFATWNDADSSLSWLHGMVPIPPDYETSFKMDYIKYDGNNDDQVVFGSKNWSSIGKDTWDLVQMKFCTPLTEAQMNALYMPLVDVKKDEQLPSKFKLAQNYPNPFNPTTMIQYSIPAKSNVKLIVYNSIGQAIKTLVNKDQAAGNYSVSFDGEQLTSGMYFCTLKTEKFTKTIKMLLLK